MYCVPNCRVCVVAGTCPKGELPATAVHSYKKVANPTPDARVADWSPNRLPLTDMPCGCHTIPWPILTVLGSNIQKFWCDKHGEVNISQAWRKRKEKDSAKVLTDELLFL